LRVLAVVHQRDAAAGVFGEAARADGHELIEWLVPEQPAPSLDEIDAAMVFGGAMNVDEAAAYPWLDVEKALLRDLLARERPTLGICLGAQLLAEAAGGMVKRAPHPEIGWGSIELTAASTDDPLHSSLPTRFDALQWHSYEALLPPGATALAESETCLQAYRLPGGRTWGLQFHPEVTAADLGSWLDGWRSDADAVRIGIDPDAIRRQSEQRIEAWNELGRGLARRFLATAAH
jgi:GMP synthase (glutamine-hydrolysing)